MYTFTCVQVYKLETTNDRYVYKLYSYYMQNTMHKRYDNTQILSTRKYIHGIGKNNHKNATYIYACFEVLSQVLWLIDM